MMNTLLFLVSAAGIASGTLAQTAETRPDWRAELATPRPEFSPMPFWFWNDRLEEKEIRRQMADFREHGVYGFVIHARMGLPKDIPYMGPRWLQLVRAAVDEAARTGMRVCLYDEGMYPSGSAHGEVVRSNPAYAARGLACVHKDASGPAEIDLPSEPAGKTVAAVIARRVTGRNAIDLASARLLDATSVKVAVPEGEWRVMVFANVPSEGRIRGVHKGEDDREPHAPPAADLLNPDAMRAFLRFAYDPYYETLKEHFGKTVIGMFTDEPSLLGRGGRRGLKPWTDGIAEDFAKRRGYPLPPRLPALFFDCGSETARIREDFARTLGERLDETYYRPLSQWCEAHGIALTGHPAGNEEIGPLRYYQLPGQDIVWRSIVPGDRSALEGPHSVLGKSSSSVALHDGRRRNLNEVYGAYGWDLTMEEMKWVADWLMVRGVNLLSPHAFYYSIRDFRALERPPDVGPNNTWWPHYRVFADYTSRICGLLVDSLPVCDVAILCGNHAVPWPAAKWLQQNQIDFNYVEDWRIREKATIENGALRVGPMRYRTLIVDPSVPPPDEAVAAVLRAFGQAGGTVRRWVGEPERLFPREARGDLVVDPPSADLRVRHLVKHGIDYYLLVNEGEAEIAARISVPRVGKAEWFDAWTGRFRPAAVTQANSRRMRLPVRLGRRESIILCVDTNAPALAATAYPPASAPTSEMRVPGPWRLTTANGKPPADGLGDWAASPDAAAWVGTVTYTTSFDLPAPGHDRWELDLGGVGDWAVVTLNGTSLGPRFWAPYSWDVTAALRAGRNELGVEVTNSLVNRYDPKKKRASGLFGPVILRSARVEAP